VTGLGTPIANLLVPDLIAGNFPASGQVAPISAAGLVYTAPSGDSAGGAAQALNVFSALTMGENGVGSFFGPPQGSPLLSAEGSNDLTPFSCAYMLALKGTSTGEPVLSAALSDKLYPDTTPAEVPRTSETSLGETPRSFNHIKPTCTARRSSHKAAVDTLFADGQGVFMFTDGLALAGA
jgi:hypothetical protein